MEHTDAPPTCQSRNKEPAALAVLVMLVFSAVKVVPLLFHVCVIDKTGNEEVCVAPVSTKHDVPTASVRTPLVPVNTPSTGVINVGLVAKTLLPVPVLVVSAASRFALD